MKKLFLYISLLFFSTNFTTYVKADIIETFCLVRNYHLTDSNLNPNDYDRFAGGVIKLIINTKEKKIINDSENFEMALMTGIVDSVEYRGTGELIRFRNKIEVENGKIKYDYRVKVKIFDNVSVPYFEAKVLQRGFSMQKWEFKIDCFRDYPPDIDIENAKIFKPEKKDLNLPNLNMDLIKKEFEEIKKKNTTLD